MPEHRTFRSTTRFGSLDGLRCISIVAVIWHHFPALHFNHLLKNGLMGVQLFFVISGFLITTLLLRERESKGSISMRKFYMRRTLRILPIYYTMLALYTVLVFFLKSGPPRDEFFGNMPYFLTYTSNWFVGDAGGVVFSFSWSLATEEQFYLFWPSVERLFRGWLPVVIMLSILALVLAADYGLADALIPKGGPANIVVTSVPVTICMGVLLAHLLHSPRGFRAASLLLGHRYSSLLSLLALLAYLALPLSGIFFVSLAMAFLVGSCVAREDHWLAPVLKSRPFVEIGMVSYGMYMMHGLVKNVVSMALPSDPGGLLYFTEFVISTGLTFTVAALSFRYYEGYFLRLKRRYEIQRT